MNRARLDPARPARTPAFVAALALATLVALGFGLLQLLPQPAPAARLAASSVAVVGHEQIVQSTQVVSDRPPLTSVCLPGVAPHSSVIWLGGGDVVTVTPRRVLGSRARRQHDLLAVEAALAGCPRELERLMFPRVDLRFEHHEPIGLRPVWLGGRRGYELVFHRHRLRIAVVLSGSTLRPVEIRVHCGRLSGWSRLRQVVFGSASPLTQAQPA